MASGAPPDAVEYQFNTVPAPPVAFNVTVPEPQRVAGVVESTCGLSTMIGLIFEVSEFALHDT